MVQQVGIPDIGDKNYSRDIYQKHEPEKNVELKIGDKNIRFEKSVKFLGMIFDRRLTWNEHISYVVERCKKRLNLLRALQESIGERTKRR